RARSFAVHCARWPWLCRQTCIRACAMEKDRAGISGVITSRSMDHGLGCGIGSTLAGGIVVLLFSWVFRNLLATRPTVAGALYGAGAGLAINAGWRIACPISHPWHALGAHGAAIVATVLLGALFGRFLGNRKLHIGGGSS